MALVLNQPSVEGFERDGGAPRNNERLVQDAPDTIRRKLILLGNTDLKAGLLAWTGMLTLPLWAPLAGDLLSVAAGKLASNLTSSAEVDGGQEDFPQDYTYEGKTLEFSPGQANTIKVLKEQFGLDTVSPETWHDARNLLWEPEETNAILEANRRLPWIYHHHPRSPKIVLFLKPTGTAGGSEGGNYTGRGIEMLLPEDFNVTAKPNGRRADYFSSNREALIAAHVHEQTHSVQEAYPDIVEEWVRLMGWSQDETGNWRNNDPDSLIQYGNSRADPSEDMASSAGVMVVNPNALSENREKFFRSNQRFNGWI